jgi:hypothetical protein
LNPNEGNRDVLKNDKLRNYCPRDLSELRETVEAELSLLKRSRPRTQQEIRRSALDWELLRSPRTPSAGANLSAQT